MSKILPKYVPVIVKIIIWYYWEMYHCQTEREHNTSQLPRTITEPRFSQGISTLEMTQHQATRFVINKSWNRHHHDSITEMLK